MNRLKIFLKDKWIYLAAFSIPWLVVVIHSFVYDTWVTGGGSILGGDAGAQYVQLFYELWDKIHSGESLFYTWHAFGGVDFYVNAAYYLCSPFTLVVLAFPRAWICNTVQFIMVLKFAFASVSMVYFFYHTRHNTLKKNKKLISLFLGLAWGLSNGMINYMEYMSWMDVMILFPLLLLLVEKMVQNNTWKLYYILLTICMLCNFYMSYHIGLFLLLWFGMQLESDTMEKCKKFITFIGSSVLAVISGMMVILPSLAAEQVRRSQGAEEELKGFAGSILNSLYDVLESFFIFDSISVPTDIRPNLYFSVIALILAFLFIFIKINKKKKAYILSVTLFMSASLFFGFLNLIWHGFSIPHGVYNRFVDIYIFLLLFLGLQVLIHLKEIQMNYILLTGVVGFMTIVITFLGVDVYQGVHVYLGTSLLFVLYIIILVYFKKKSITYSGVLTTFAVLGILEMTINGFFALSPIYDMKLFFNGEGGRQILELTDELDVPDGERIAYQRKYCNWGMVAGQSADSGFLSYGNGSYIQYNEKLGLTYSDRVLTSCVGGSPLLNLMFNIRYAVGESNVIVSDADAIAEQDGYYLYETKRLAGLGYMVDDTVEQWDITAEMPFDLQNTFVKYAVGGKDIFTVVKMNPVCVSSVNELEPNEKAVEQGVYLYSYPTQFGNTNDYCQLEFVMEEDMDLYMMVKKSIGMNDYVLVDGEEVYMTSLETAQSMIHIGKVKKGQTVTYVAFPSTSIAVGIDVGIYCQFAKFNEEHYTDIYDKLSKNVYQIEKMEADYVKGTIYTEKNGLMMTSIQAGDGFTVRVDGTETDYKVIGDCMIGIPLDIGEHTIEFAYRTPYFDMGVIISLVGMLCFVGICIKQKYVSHAKENSAE